MEFLTPIPIRIPIIRWIALPIFYFILLTPIQCVVNSAPLPAGQDCADEIVRFSTCLPYVSSYPNNISSSAPSFCCDSFSSALIAGDGVCFCYLLRQPLILGLPVNTTRILSLSSVCAPENGSYTSLESLCAGSPALPPLQGGSISPAFTNPSAPPVPADSGSPSASITLQPEDDGKIHAPMKAPGLHFLGDGHSCRSDVSVYFSLFLVGFCYALIPTAQ